MRKIKLNRLKCLLCGDVITSTHRHDFVTCSCGAFSVDGGNEYLRRAWRSDIADYTKDCEDLSEYEDEVSTCQT